MRTLLVYTGNSVSDSVQNKLKDTEHNSVSSSDEKDIFNKIKVLNPDIVVFDCVKVGNNEESEKIIDKIRRTCGAVPIMVIVSMVESPHNIQRLLDFGADSCIKGEFALQEFLLRAKKLIDKKNNLLFIGTKIKIHNTSLDFKSHSVCISDREVYLTKTEYSILLHLFLHKNSLVRVDDLNSCLKDGDLVRSTYLLNIHMHNLRKKLMGADWIKTITNYGFMATE